VSDVDETYLTCTSIPGVYEVKRTFNPGSNGLSLALMRANMPSSSGVLVEIFQILLRAGIYAEDEEDEIQARYIKT